MCQVADRPDRAGTGRPTVAGQAEPLSRRPGTGAADVFALAGYTSPRQLPTLRPYLRAKYGELPEQAVRDVEAYLARLQQQYGTDSRPTDGEDELPE